MEPEMMTSSMVYDRTVTTKSISKNFDFIVRVSDGTSFVEQNNSIFVYSADFWRVSNTAITIDKTEMNGSALTMDLSANRRPVFRTGSDLGTFRHDNALVIKIDVEDFDPTQSDLFNTVWFTTRRRGHRHQLRRTVRSTREAISSRSYL